MPITLLFADPGVREICERRRVADLKLGFQAARRLRTRLADIRAATCIAEITAGSPTFSGEPDQFCISLHPPHQLLLEPANEPIPRRKIGEVDWLKIDVIRVVHVGTQK